MNKLTNTDLGGYPFILDDLRFADNSIREVFKGQLNHLGGKLTNLSDGIILHEKLNYSYDSINGFVFPETWVFMDGEFWLCPQTTLTTSAITSKHYIFEKDIAFDGSPEGTKTFEDGNVHGTYQIRRAKLTLVNSAPLPVGSETTFVALTCTTAGVWSLYTSNVYGTKLNKYLGVDTMKNEIATLTTDLNIAENNILIAQAEINILISAPIEPNATQINSVVKFSSASNGSGTLLSMGANSSGILDLANSSIRIKRLGSKTVLVDFVIKKLKGFSFDTGQIASVVFNNLGSFLPTNQSFKPIHSSFRLDCTTHNGVVSGQGRISTSAINPKSVVLSMPAPMVNTDVAWNREYQEDGFGNLTVTGATTFVPEFNLAGQFVVENY